MADYQPKNIPKPDALSAAVEKGLYKHWSNTTVHRRKWALAWRLGPVWLSKTDVHLKGGRKDVYFFFGLIGLTLGTIPMICTCFSDIKHGDNKWN
mmetsp:Transcript_25320/g.28164  ORF Transcript_25320/g.28164 Transcript_25320/m.28164 type:complete len:95 (-) Transcript_25320:108-392(-)